MCKIITRMISRVLYISTLVLTLLILGVSSTVTENKGASFGYMGTHGPGEWGRLSPEYSECAKGKLQSPLNIMKTKVVRSKIFKPLTRNYVPANATLCNNQFNIGVKYEGDAGSMEVNGKTYSLKQMHWHSPSEHRLNGVRYPVELHLVHQAEDLSLSVVAILFNYSTPDPLLLKIKEKMEELSKEVCAGNEEAHVPLGILDLKLLKKNTRKYYRYVGSLTTPPCYENVLWTVLGKVRSISHEQVAAIKAPLKSDCKNNARPCQPLNGRMVELYEDLSRN
ncbi:alpha carbonic anhydrase 1, chloroplastic [Humulus lupulus]|uniref:alpha carbonic anhydrase 1, chloroplastic n=1 Tax=Humulus lupulus TaxID=3486 RepID=UPI002B417D8A|nr:alpha carbonic anhydrase 1, chloroplastic [Humulus lupulus]